MPGYSVRDYCQARRITSADGEVQIFTGKGALCAVSPNSADSDANVNVWDTNTTGADAALIAEIMCPATGKIEEPHTFPGAGVRVTTGLRAAVDGSSNVAYIYYRSG